MTTFKDTQDRTWTITVNVDAIRKVRDLLGVNLNKALDDNFKLLTGILEDPIALVDVVFCLCKEQADAAKVSDQDFGRAMSGDSLMAAGEAFLEAITDFFPNARARAMLKKIVEKGRAVRDLLTEKAEKQIDELDAQKIASTLSVSFGNSPASVELTPPP